MSPSIVAFLDRHKDKLGEAGVSYDPSMNEYSWTLYLRVGDSARRFITAGYFATSEEAERDLRAFATMYL